MDFSLKRISHVSIFLLFITLLKSILSIAVRSSMAACFGATDASDAYFAAFFVPQQLSDFFIGGILFIIIIPVFQKRISDVGSEEASKDISALLNISVLAMGIMTIAYFILAPWLIPFFFSGFHGEKLELAVWFSKLLSPAVLLMGLSLIYISFYHAYRDFFIPSLASLMFPLSSLVSIWMLPDSWGIERLIYGNLAGSILGVFILIIGISSKLRWKWNRWELGNPLIRSTILLSWPVILESTFSRIHPFVQRNIASELPGQGVITLIELSLFVVGSLIAFIAGPIATAVFPLMGQQRLDEDEQTVFQTFLKSLRVMIFMILPLNMLLLFESGDIVNLLFRYGKFTDESCTVMANILLILSFIIIPNCFSSIGSRVLFVYHETKAISFTGIALGLFILPFYFIAAKFAGIYGLVSVVSAGAFLSALLVFTILKVKHPSVSFSQLYSFIPQMAACAVIMGTGMSLAKFTLKNLEMPTVLRFSIVSLTGCILFILAAKLLKIDELSYIVKRIPYVKNLAGVV